MHFRYVSMDVSAGDMVLLFGGITITCPMLLLNQPHVKVWSEKVLFSVANQLFKQLWLLTPGNAGPSVPTETVLTPAQKKKERGTTGHGAEQEKAFKPLLSRSSSIFLFIFSPFPERQRNSSAICEREHGKRKMCMPDCLQRMGSARGKNGVCSPGG